MNLRMPFWKLPDLPIKLDSEIKGEKRKRDQYDAKRVDSYNGYEIERGITDHAEEVAEKLKLDGLDKDFEIVLPRPNQLMVDYDVHDMPERFQEALDMLTQAFCEIGARLLYRISRSRHGNLHVLIDLPRDIGDIERVAWQSVFGSDFKRDGISLMSIARQIKNPVLFFERKGQQPIFLGVSSIEAKTGRMFRREHGDSNGGDESRDSDSPRSEVPAAS